ncbi:MLP family protein [Proteus mirabilis]|nr:MLP family protein [Proteus mirabilis]
MDQPSLGKLHGEVELESDAQTIYEVYARRPDQISNICPKTIHSCTPHHGKFGKTGSIIEWTYFHDGELKKTKEIIGVDDEKTKIVFKIIGGHFSGDSKDFKEFLITLDFIPNATGGCVARWTFDYEKLDASIADPQSMLQFLMKINKDIDAHLQKA